MYATKQTNYQQIAKSFGATATSNNTDDSIKSSVEFDRQSLTMTRSRSPAAMVSSSRDNSSDSGIASPTLTGTFDWPVTCGSGCCDDVPFIKIQSLNKQLTTSDGVYSNESGVCQTDVSSEEVAPRSKYQTFHQLCDVTDDEDDVLLDERTAFESELSWKDDYEKDNNDDELSPPLSCSFVSGLPDHVTFDDDTSSSSDDDSDGVSKPMMIPNAHQRQRSGRSFLVSTPTTSAGIDVDACYPAYPCSFQKREAPATSNIYQMMQQLRMQTRPSESDIFVYPSHARGHIVPGRCQVGFNQTPNLSCI